MKPTKTERTFMDPLDELINEFGEAQEQSDPLSFDQLRRLMDLCLENRLSDAEVQKNLDEAFATFETLANILPVAESRLLAGASGLVFAVLHNKLAVACEVVEVERSRSTQKGKQLAKERAWQIAAQLWKADTDKKIRISEMADKVYKALLSEGFADQLPGKPEQLTKWLKQKKKEFDDPNSMRNVDRMKK